MFITMYLIGGLFFICLLLSLNVSVIVSIIAGLFLSAITSIGTAIMFMNDKSDEE